MATDLKLFVDGNAGSQITNITGTDPATIYTANADKDRRVNQIIVSTDDTSDAVATLKMSDGTDSITLGKVTIPDGSGTNVTDAAVDLVASLATVFTQEDAAGNKYLDVPKGWSLSVTMSAVTSGKQADVVVIGAAE